jgi:hypothetical protein
VRLQQAPAPHADTEVRVGHAPTPDADAWMIPNDPLKGKCIVLSFATKAIKLPEHPPYTV